LTPAFENIRSHETDVAKIQKRFFHYLKVLDKHLYFLSTKAKVLKDINLYTINADVGFRL